MTRHVTRADLSFPIGPINPDTGERPRVKRIPGASLETDFPVPWPMTPVGARLYALGTMTGTILAVFLAVWVGFQIFEPSLLRLVPAVLTLLAFKFLVIPGLYSYGRRSGMDRREVEGE